MQFSDFANPEFFADPYPTYARLRAEGGIVAIAPGIWLTGNYAIADSLLCDRRMGRAYDEGVRLRYGEQRRQDPVFQAYGRMLLLLNPPDHTRLRGLLMKVFNARQIAELRQLVQTLADELLDRVQAQGQADLVRDYALPLPMAVICSLLGVPATDGLLFSAAVNAMVKALDFVPMDVAQLAAANQATLQLQEYFGALLAERRRQPGHDLISLLLSAEDQGQRFADEEIIANIVLLFLAGHETTASMIGNSLIALHRHPHQLAELQADPALLPAAVAECLRYDGSVQLTMRAAQEDLSVAGHDIKQGQLVYISLGAANRDPQQFAEPDVLNIHRREQNGRQLTFGGGIHYCLGARLATVELEVALATLFRRLPNLQLTHLQQLNWYPRNTLRGVDSLLACW